MIDTQKRSAAFVRGFFIFLEEQQIRAAVLHGGADGFERDLSDVDFVVVRRMFPQLPGLIHGYCDQSGWRLCQILRHETTAAYFVCSAADAPACAVALDACSDYQRNGTPYLKAEELLAERKLLPWGGFEPGAGAMLRYRFAKAAGKSKDTGEAAREFEGYPPEARAECSLWLENGWGIRMSGWDGSSVAAALSALRIRSNSRPPLIAGGAWRRVVRRLLQPTGMVVVTGHENHVRISEMMARVFGRLHFRKVSVSPSFGPSHLKDLAASTLILVPSLGGKIASLITRSCIHHVDLRQDSHAALDDFARTLAARCAARERKHERP